MTIENTLTPRECFLKALLRKEPDRVPTFEIFIDPKVTQAILPGSTYEDFVEAMDLDCVVSPTPSNLYDHEYIKTDSDYPCFRTEWGEIRADTGEIISIPIKHPINNHADWDRYQVPDPDKPGRLDSLKTLVNRFKGKRAVGCHLHDSFSYPSYLFGLDYLMMNLILDPGWVMEVVNACLNHTVRMVELAVEAGADFIVVTDDVGGKSGPLMSPALYEKFFLPGLAKVVQTAKSHNIPVIKHTDGNVWKLFDMFVEADIDGFHPSDPSAGMDIVEVKRQYGQHFAVLGGIDTGDPLSHWPVEQLVAEVRQRIRQLAPGGGWLIGSSNSIHSSVKPENYHAMVLATQIYSHYHCLDRPVNLDLESRIGIIPITQIKT